MYFSRTLEDRLMAASEQFPVLLLTGPRQVGKTTLLQHLCGKGRRYVTMDDMGLRALAREDPALFFQRFQPPVLIDEIQYAPNLLPYIKMQVDSSRRTGEFWLTGSQQFHMMKGVTESLAGRVAIINMLGFSGRERRRKELRVEPFFPVEDNLHKRERTAEVLTLKSAFRDIVVGGYPALIAGKVTDRELFFRSYVQTYIERDVRDLAQVGDCQAFVRFLKACAARTAQLLNLSELARDVDISVPTARNWLSILETDLQVYLLRPYHTNVTKRLVKTPKLYFLDTGLAAYLTEWTSPETLGVGAMSGAFFETYVLAEILKSWWHRLESPALFYYRDKDGKEIDFLFERDQTIYPVEAKLGAGPKRDWVKHFGALKKLKRKVGDGGVICLCEEHRPLTDTLTAIPAGML